MFMSSLRPHGAAHKMGGADALTSYTLSNDILHNNVAVVNSSAAAYTKVKETKVEGLTGIVRVSFGLNNGSCMFASGRIYINGVAVGAVHTNSTSGYVYYIDDVLLADGDLVQVYVSADGSNNCATRELCIRGVLDRFDVLFT